MEITAVGVSDVGQVRELNEDFLLEDPSLRLFVVCDGMGGHAAGEVASRTTATTVQAQVKEHEAVLRAVERGEQPHEAVAGILRTAIEKASRDLFAQGMKDRSKKGMGTTCTAVVVIGGKGVLGHVGDSRCYLVRQGKLFQLSEDHTFLQEAIRHGMMTPEQAKLSSHGNIVTRAVGPLESVMVDTLVFDFVAGDTLLLCSDGLHQYFGEGEELPAIVGKEGSIEATPGKLVGMANDRGGSDNVTAIVIRALAGDAEEEHTETQRMTLVNATFDTLQHVELLSELSSSELMRVTSACRPLDVPAGQAIISETEVSETLYVLLEGQVVVERQGNTLAILGAGAHFGEMALLSQRPRSATVRAKSACRLLALDRATFYTLLQQDALLATKFLWKLAQTLSLRLDDVYLLAESHASAANKTTLRFGLYPSPFTFGAKE
jgi:serine/threonine protein phosphatase PrpC/CRP-like cAMP-binding protein